MSIRTEREKMLAGELYNIFDSALEAERKNVKRVLRIFNFTEDESERKKALHQILGNIGQNSMIEPPFYCSYGRNTYIGNNVYLNFMCTILDNNEVHIGNNVMIGPVTQIYTAAHPLQMKKRIQGWEVARQIVIEDNTWIGGNVTILPGVKIGRNAVVGAGAIVTKNVPANTVVVGNPARVIKEIEQE